MESRTLTGHDLAVPYEEQEIEHFQEVIQDIAYETLYLVNVAFIGHPTSRSWVLVDAGVPGTTNRIIEAANERFGQGLKPEAIILTHGHFDHVGALEELLAYWNVPVYAHPLERPYLTGRESYPSPNPKAGGGLMSPLSRFFPTSPIDVSGWLRSLPPNGVFPFLPGWGWIHTPGHTSGHISLWRETDRFLIAGDAFVTTRQESVYSVVRQEPAMHGPPMYYTPDWPAAADSVRRLSQLEPEFVISGHGPAVKGENVRRELHSLAEHFYERAVPKDQRQSADHGVR